MTNEEIRVKITQEGFKCLRCGETWIPHDITKKPRTCPKCRSPYWDLPKKK